MVHFHLPHHGHKQEKTDESAVDTRHNERKMSHTSTISSTTSSSNSTGSTGRSSFSLTGHHTHKRPSHFTFEYKEAKTPIEVCETALKLLYTHPGPSCEEMREVLIPKLFHAAYVHRVNCRELDLNGLLDIIQFIRTKWKHSHIRIRSILMDEDGTATMQQAAVACTFDLIAMPHHQHSHEAEEKRTTAVAVLKLYEGRLAQCDEVIETNAMKMPHQELSCSIM